VTYKSDLKDWILEAIDASGGRATLVEIAKHIWHNHEDELRQYGDAFYKWQYDMRWAAQYLRDEGILASAAQTERGIWERKKLVA